MASSVRGFSVKDVTQHGRPQLSNLCVNPGKVLPSGKMCGELRIQVS